MQRGAISVEAVIIIPALVLLLALLGAGWRISWAKAQLGETAAAAARAASIPRSASQARQAANDTVNANLASLGFNCQNTRIVVDTSAFALPLGTKGQVSVDMACRLQLADLGLVGLPGSVQLSAQATEQLDSLRKREP